MHSIQVKVNNEAKKYTKEDIAKIWNKVYGEDISTEYEGFFNKLK